MIPLPNELRGKLVVSFTEWDTEHLNKLNAKISEMEIAWKTYLPKEKADTYLMLLADYLATKMQVNSFYNQPFTVEMIEGDNRLFEEIECDTTLLEFVIKLELPLDEFIVIAIKWVKYNMNLYWKG